MLKSQIYAYFDTLPVQEGEGLLFGLASGSLTLAEIEEAIEANGPISPAAGPEKEQAMRPVFLLGAMGASQDATRTESRILNENGGAQIVTKPRWTFTAGDSWNWFVYNQGQTMTGNAVIRITAKSWGLYLR